tara:strand:+ start:1118 stop:1267 length:150 start_codon:yes stop_codon:yes gene_type:complete
VLLTERFLPDKQAEIGGVHQATFLNGDFIYELNTFKGITIAVAKCDSFD